MSYSQPLDYRGMPPEGGKTNNGLAIASLSVGIVSLLLAWVPIVNCIALPLALLGLILGIVGWVSASKNPSQKPTLAIVGIILSILAVPSFFISYAVFSAALERAGGNLVQFGLTTGANQEADSLAAQARARGVDEDIITAARDKLNATLDTVTTDLEDADRAASDVEDALEEYRSTLQNAPGSDEAGAGADEEMDEPTTQPGASGGA